jgi:hypothetical protein
MVDSVTMSTRAIHLATALGLFCLLMGAYLFTYTGYPVSNDENALFSSAESLVKYGNMNIRSLYYQYPGSKTEPWSPPVHEPMQILVDAVLYKIAWEINGLGLMQTVWLSNILITALIGVVFYFTGLKLGYTRSVSLTAALMVGLGTMLWPYSQMHFRESLAAFWTLLLVFLSLRIRQGWGWIALLFGVGLLSLLTKAVLILNLPMLVWLMLPQDTFTSRQKALRYGVVLLGITVSGLILMTVLSKLLNNDRFDLTGYLTRTEGTSLKYALSVVGAFLFSPGRSLWAGSPILLASIYGTWRATRDGQTKLALAPWILLFSVTLAYAFGGWDWHGGQGWGTRYLLHVVPVMGLLLLPVISEGRWKVPLAALMAFSILIQMAGLLVPLNTFYAEMAARFPGQELDAFYTKGVWSLTETPWYIHLKRFDLQQMPIALRFAEPAWAIPVACALLLGLGMLLMIRPPKWLWAWGVVAAVGALLACGMTLISLESDSRYRANEPALTALVAEAKNHVGSNDLLLLANPEYKDIFLNTYKGAGTLAVLPYEFGERYSPAEPEPVVIDPDNNGSINFKERISGATNNMLEYSLFEHDYENIWFVTNLGPFHTFAYRPSEQLFATYSYLTETISITEEARLLRFAAIPNQVFEQFLTRHRPIHFGENLTLLGYDVPAHMKAGQVLPIQLAWQGENIPLDYSVAFMLTDSEGTVHAQQDGTPQGGFNPFTRLYAVNVEGRGLALPPDLPPGTYTVQIAVYDWRDLTRLPVDEAGGTAAEIATIEVLAPNATWQATSHLIDETPLDTSINVTLFEGITLMGYSIPATAEAGDTLTLRSAWDVSGGLGQPFNANFTLGSSQKRHLSTVNYSALSLFDDVFFEGLHTYEHTLYVPLDLPTGKYQIYASTYDWRQQLPSELVELGTICIGNCD